MLGEPSPPHSLPESSEQVGAPDLAPGRFFIHQQEEEFCLHASATTQPDRVLNPVSMQHLRTAPRAGDKTNRVAARTVAAYGLEGTMVGRYVEMLRKQEERAPVLRGRPGGGCSLVVSSIALVWGEGRRAAGDRMALGLPMADGPPVSEGRQREHTPSAQYTTHWLDRAHSLHIWKEVTSDCARWPI